MLFGIFEDRIEVVRHCEPGRFFILWYLDSQYLTQIRDRIFDPSLHGLVVYFEIDVGLFTGMRRRGMGA